MNRKLIIRVLGAILAIEALAMIPAFLVSLYYRDGDTAALGYSIILTLAVGSGMHLIPRTDRNSYLRLKEGYIITAVGWILMSLFGCLPYLLSGMLPRFEAWRNATLRDRPLRELPRRHGGGTNRQHTPLQPAEEPRADAPT